MKEMPGGRNGKERTTRISKKEFVARAAIGAISLFPPDMAIVEQARNPEQRTPTEGTVQAAHGRNEKTHESRARKKHDDPPEHHEEFDTGPEKVEMLKPTENRKTEAALAPDRSVGNHW